MTLREPGLAQDSLLGARDLKTLNSNVKKINCLKGTGKLPLRRGSLHKAWNLRFFLIVIAYKVSPPARRRGSELYFWPKLALKIWLVVPRPSSASLKADSQLITQTTPRESLRSCLVAVIIENSRRCLSFSARLD